jgi:ABC-type microcin C transport system permease subunit YejE
MLVSPTQSFLVSSPIGAQAHSIVVPKEHICFELWALRLREEWSSFPTMFYLMLSIRILNSSMCRICRLLSIICYPEKPVLKC